MINSTSKSRMHPRNRFRDGYDFAKLIASSSALSEFVSPNAYGDESIDYANPDAVKSLNQALLKAAYGIETWGLPPGYLCPPIPGRSDYLHCVADLLSAFEPAAIPRGRSVAVLDIGTGASCIYPLIGASEYGWRFVGSETDERALRFGADLAAANRSVADQIELRFQPSALKSFTGVIRPGEVFHLSMCNPPFHASAAEATALTLRKRRNLGEKRVEKTVRNFGGQAGELWCPGGELGFVRRMIAESAGFSHQCRWFTTLVSRSSHLPRLRQALNDVRAVDVKTLEMGQGQKQSRILAWTFQGT
jgi:23S rRNA (adenine1618-N6)-methyltransferase